MLKDKDLALRRAGAVSGQTQLGCEGREAIRLEYTPWRKGLSSDEVCVAMRGCATQWACLILPLLWNDSSTN